MLIAERCRGDRFAVLERISCAGTRTDCGWCATSTTRTSREPSAWRDGASPRLPRTVPWWLYHVGAEAAMAKEQSMSVVLVNAFEVPDGQEEKFLADWQHAADWMRQQPGFVSSRLHQSLDPDAEFRYVNVAEWESADHFGKAAASPEFQQRTSGMNVRAHPALYRVVVE
jgi:heme oxygenase (mycobilin-producing)